LDGHVTVVLGGKPRGGVLNVADAEVRYTLDIGKGIGWPRRSRPCRVVLGGEYLLTGKRKGSESPEYSHGWRNRGKVYGPGEYPLEREARGRLDGATHTWSPMPKYATC
jgi:hypothetical protein